MSSSTVRAGGAFVEIFAKDAKFQQSLSRVQAKLRAVSASMQATGMSMMAVGSAIATPILAAAKSFASAGGAIYEMSQRTGVAAESLSVLRFAAEQTGTDLAGMETSIRKMQKTIFEAGQGSKEAADALGLVGLSAAALQGLTPEEQLGKIADGLNMVQDPGNRAAIAMGIFGKSGTSLLPMLEGGAAGLAKFGAEAKRLGLVMDAETAAKADALDDALAALSSSMKMAFIQVGSAVAPLLTDMAQRLSGAAAAAGKFISENQGLVNTVLRVSAGLAVAGGAVYAFGTVIGGLQRVIGGVSQALSLVPLLFTPIGAIGTVIAGAIGIAISAARTLSPAFKAETDGIMAAIMALDFGTAWEIMNLNFAIALTQMAAKASSILGQINGFFASTGSFIADKLIGGLDMFMGVFGADIVTLQNAWERIGIYFRAAFDWKWAITGMNAALREADAAAERARAKAPTTSARAADRTAARQAAADDRQTRMDRDAKGWSDTIEVLREDLQRAHDRLKTTPAEAAQDQQPAKPVVAVQGLDLGDAAANLSAMDGGSQAASRGSSAGTFGSGAGLGIASEIGGLESSSAKTAANTTVMAQAIPDLAKAFQAAAGNSAAGGSQPGNVAAGGVGAAAGAAALADVPAMAKQAQAGAAQASFATQVSASLTQSMTAVVAAINQHAAISKMNGTKLDKIAENTAHGGFAFS